MADSGAIRAGAAFVELFTKDADFEKGLRKAQKNFSAWGKGISAAGRAVFAAGAGMATPLLAAAGVFGKLGSEMARASIKTGVPVEQLSALKYAADQSGVAFETLQKAMAKMAKVTIKGVEGNPEAVKAFTLLKLNAQELGRLSPDQKLAKISDALANIKSPDLKISLVKAIFGNSGVELLPLLDKGAAGIAKLTGHAKELGIVMSGKDAAAGLKFQQTLSDLWEVIQMGVFTVGGSLAPVLGQIVQHITAGIGAVKQFIDRNRELVVMVGAVAGGLLIGGAALVGIGGAFSLVAGVIGTVLTGFGVLATVVGAVVSPLGLMVAAIAAGTYALIHFTSIGASVKNYMSGIFGGLKTDALSAFQGIRDAMAGGDWATAAQILWTALKLVWAKGTAGIWAPLLTNFYVVKGALLDAWSSLAEGLETAWTYAIEYLTNWNGIKNAASKFIVWLHSAWTTAINYLADKWRNLHADLEFPETEKIIRAKMQVAVNEGKLTPRQAQEEGDRIVDIARENAYGPDDSARKKAEQADFDKQQKALDDQYKSSNSDDVNHGNEARNRIHDEQEARRLADAKELSEKIASLNGSTDKAKIDALQKQLDDLNKKAASEATAAKAKEDKAPTVGASAFDPDAAADAMTAVAKRTISGTFSAQGLYGLAGDSSFNAKLVANTAKSAAAQERANKLLEVISRSHQTFT